MNLTNRLAKIEERTHFKKPFRYVAIYPDDDPNSEGEYERTRPGWQPRLTSKEEAIARYPGENLFFIVVRRDHMPLAG